MKLMELFSDRKVAGNFKGVASRSSLPVVFLAIYRQSLPLATTDSISEILRGTIARKILGILPVFATSIILEYYR